MIKRYLFFLFCLFLFTYCKPKSPALLIPEEKLVDVLVDAHIAEASIQNLTNKVKDSIGAIYYSQIYQIHQVDSAAFQQTMTIAERGSRPTGKGL